ncbi:hypothetical protein HK098_003842 [Nowakowskiella sp. JEL0407]|nr:hypothetical protein HK098_003842 [Nowakowskiella sp. JEL0407]
MRKYFYYLALATELAGIAGIIAHTVSFNTQKSPIVNTFIPAWYAGVFLFTGLHLAYLLWKPSRSVKAFWFEVVFTGLLLCAQFISLVCYGIAANWPTFIWILVSFITIGISVYQILNRKDGYRSISTETGESEKPASKEPFPLKFRILSGFVYFLKVVVLFIVALLTAGAVSIAIAFSFPAPGRSVSVFFEGANQNGTMQLYCTGKTNSSMPTTFIFSTSAHGIVDMYGLQYYLTTLKSANRRVCVNDPIGFGWSQDAFEGQFTSFEFLYNLMLQSGEPSPWNLVGWGGGGSAITYLAAKHPSNIKTISFIETYPPGIEFNYYGVKNKLDQNALANYRNSQLASRFALVNIILSLAIPWGLMSLFVPIIPRADTYYPPNKWMEFRVQMWKSQAWISQYQGLQHIQSTPDSEDPLYKYAPIPANIAVLGVYCNLTNPCIGKYQNRTGDDCSNRIAENKYYTDQKVCVVEIYSIKCEYFA